MMIKLNKKQVLKAVKTTAKTLLYRLKSEVKKMAFNNSLKPAHHKSISENEKKIDFINAYISRKKRTNKIINRLIRQSIFQKEPTLITFSTGK
ncbi:hypothetical protein PTE_02307 [Photorhabdus khanii NC19]|uniref:Uncharacterized protein n=2 Tax=Photorhabdus khanii TaxID=1004150 RepID=W3V9A2_9GAMM|nr:hypothetical protein [Photorhabdus khanii]ETS31619.1 hypothetical protein PTE_02307 [Photorhabdus khanii NC19]MQL49175.1 hypothetical protein [Photorhabdus khanii]